jgi:serine/threonine-protein kinase HipA
MDGSPYGFALSEDLPLQTGLMLPAERDTAVGAVDDARPDQWGERVIRLIERPPACHCWSICTLQAMTALVLWACRCNGRLCAAPTAAMPTFDGLADMHQAVQRVMAGEAVSEAAAALAAAWRVHGRRTAQVLDADRWRFLGGQVFRRW